MNRLAQHGPRWKDVLAPAQLQDFEHRRAMAEIRRLELLDRKLNALLRQPAPKPRVR